jgi:ParB family transcriptional regulator, chromosome partitioning protein
MSQRNFSEIPMSNPTRQQLDIKGTFKDALGRGMAEDTPVRPQAAKYVGRSGDPRSFKLRVDRIRVDADQVRQMEKDAGHPEVRALAESIAEVGLINAIEVRYVEEDDIYEVVSGERRFTAVTKILGWTDIPVHDVDDSEERVIWRQIHENIHRKDLHPLDLGTSVWKAMREQELTIDEVASRLRKSKTFVQKALTVAEKLTPEARERLLGSGGDLGLDTVYLVATAPEEEQLSIVDEILGKGLTHRQVVSLTSEAKKRQPRSDAERSRGGRKAKTKPYSKTVRTQGGASITIKFRKTQVSPGEVLAALDEARSALAAATDAAA